MNLLAILIPTMPERRQLLDRLLIDLNRQRAGHNCIIILNEDSKQKTTGQKRNELLDAARERNASHVAFFDDDDLPGPTYIQRQMEATEGDYDCGELWGQYYENGRQLNPFHHSLIHDHWYQDEKYYYRNPNHLNCTKLSCLKDITYPEITIGEDGQYSERIQAAGVLKTQYPVKEILYHYFSGGRKDHNKEALMALRRGTSL